MLWQYELEFGQHLDVVARTPPHDEIRVRRVRRTGHWPYCVCMLRAESQAEPLIDEGCIIGHQCVVRGQPLLVPGGCRVTVEIPDLLRIPYCVPSSLDPDVRSPHAAALRGPEQVSGDLVALHQHRT